MCLRVFSFFLIVITAIVLHKTVKDFQRNTAPSNTVYEYKASIWKT